MLYVLYHSLAVGPTVSHHNLFQKGLFRHVLLLTVRIHRFEEFN
jgi:hypothetical protein